MVCHQGGLSFGWSVIRNVCSQAGLSSGWSEIRLVCHQAGLSSGRSFMKGPTVFICRFWRCWIKEWCCWLMMVIDECMHAMNWFSPTWLSRLCVTSSLIWVLWLLVAFFCLFKFCIFQFRIFFQWKIWGDLSQACQLPLPCLCSPMDHCHRIYNLCRPVAHRI